jgi:hypothetical protein
MYVSLSKKGRFDLVFGEFGQLLSDFTLHSCKYAICRGSIGHASIVGRVNKNLQLL